MRFILVLPLVLAVAIAFGMSFLPCVAAAGTGPDTAPAELESIASSEPAEERGDPSEPGDDPADEAGYDGRTHWGRLAPSATRQHGAPAPRMRSLEPLRPPPRA